MKKILGIVILMIISVTIFGQNKLFTEYPFDIVEDSLIYFNYETVNSKPYHLKLNKEQSQTLLNISDVLDSLILRGNPNGVSSSAYTLYTFTGLQNYKYNAPTNKTNEMQIRVKINNTQTARLEIYVDDEYSTYIYYSLSESAQSEIKKSIEAKKPIVKPKDEISIFPYSSMYIQYHNDSTITFKFSQTWTQAGKIVGDKTYWSINYTIDSIPEFIELLSKWKENFNKLKENKITTPVEKSIGTMFGLNMEFHYSYDNEYYHMTEDEKYSGYIYFSGVKRTYYDRHEDKYKFELLNIKGVDMLIEALTTGKDKYYQQLNAYNEKALNDKKLADDLLK